MERQAAALASIQKTLQELAFHPGVAGGPGPGEAVAVVPVGQALGEEILAAVQRLDQRTATVEQCHPPHPPHPPRTARWRSHDRRPLFLSTGLALTPCIANLRTWIAEGYRHAPLEVSAGRGAGVWGALVAR